MNKTVNFIDKKKKKLIERNGISRNLGKDKVKGKSEENNMIDKLCDIRYGDFSDIDVNDRTVLWGLGVEHEMQLFHKSKSGMKNTVILFDSQESTCYISGDKDKVGACCKMREKCYDHLTRKQISDLGVTNEEFRYLNNMQWENLRHNS